MNSLKLIAKYGGYMAAWAGPTTGALCLYDWLRLEKMPFGARRRYVSSALDLGADSSCLQKLGELLGEEHPTYVRASRVLRHVVEANQDVVPPEVRLKIFERSPGGPALAFTCPYGTNKNVIFTFGDKLQPFADWQIAFFFGHELAHLMHRDGEERLSLQERCENFYDIFAIWVAGVPACFLIKRASLLTRGPLLAGATAVLVTIFAARRGVKKWADRHLDLITDILVHSQELEAEETALYLGARAGYDLGLYAAWKASDAKVEAMAKKKKDPKAPESPNVLKCRCCPTSTEINRRVVRKMKKAQKLRQEAEFSLKSI